MAFGWSACLPGSSIHPKARDKGEAVECKQQLSVALLCAKQGVQTQIWIVIRHRLDEVRERSKRLLGPQVSLSRDRVITELFGLSIPPFCGVTDGLDKTVPLIGGCAYGVHMLKLRKASPLNMQHGAQCHSCRTSAELVNPCRHDHEAGRARRKRHLSRHPVRSARASCRRADAIRQCS